jgi:hypothetical protein
MHENRLFESASNGVTLKRLILYGGECSTIEHPVASLWLLVACFTSTQNEHRFERGLTLQLFAHLIIRSRMGLPSHGAISLMYQRRRTPRVVAAEYLAR